MKPPKQIQSELRRSLFDIGLLLEEPEYNDYEISQAMDFVSSAVRCLDDDYLLGDSSPGDKFPRKPDFDLVRKAMKQIEDSCKPTTLQKMLDKD